MFSHPWRDFSFLGLNFLCKMGLMREGLCYRVVKITTKNASYASHSAWSVVRTQLVRSLSIRNFTSTPLLLNTKAQQVKAVGKNTSRLKRKPSSWGRGLRGTHCAGAPAGSGSGFQPGGGGWGERASIVRAAPFRPWEVAGPWLRPGRAQL